MLFQEMKPIMKRDLPGRAAVAPRARLGFSLVEMLVVLAIVALLLALLLPSLGRMRETSRRGVCAARLNQIGGAIAAYRLDSGRAFGLTEYVTSGSVVDANDNMISLARYVPALNTFLCPSTRNTMSAADRLRTKPINTTGDFSSFESYGKFDSGGPIKTPTNCKGKESQIWLVFDQDNPGVNHHLGNDDNHGPDGGNVLYADTRVRWIQGPVWETRRWSAQRQHLN